MSRPWKSVPSGVARLPPSIQNGGLNISASLTGSVGSYGAMRSASRATRTSPPRMTSGVSGASRAALTSAASLPGLVRPTASRGSAGMVAIAIYLVSPRLGSPREPDARVDERIENVHDEIDRDDHEASHDHHALYQREVALEDALVQEPADARPGEDDLDDDGGVHHHHQVDAGQREHRDQRVLERVHRDDHEVRQALEPGELDVLAAEDLQHARARQPEHRRLEVPAQGQGRHDDVPPVAGTRGGQPAQPDREDQDQDEPEPEARNREPEQGDALGDVVPGAVHLHRRDDAGRDADEQRDERGRKA